MVTNGMQPQICLETFGSPNTAIFELVTMVVVFMKNPDSSVWTSAGSLLSKDSAHQ